MTLSAELVASPPIDLWPKVVRRVTVPDDVERYLLGTRFTDLAGCGEAIRTELSSLAETARRSRLDKNNLFATVEYDRNAWERVQHGLDRWAQR